MGYLSARPGHDVAREQLLAQVFGFAPTIISRALDTTVARLRAKLEVDPAVPVILQTVHGIGYRWGAPSVATTPASPPRPRRRLRIGAASVDLERGRVCRDGLELSLTTAERYLLDRLCAEQGRPLPAEALTSSTRIRRVAEERVARVVCGLRRKLGVNRHQPALRTVPGAGYALEVVHEAESALLTPELAWAMVRHVGLVLGLDDCVVYGVDGDHLVQIAAYGPKSPAAGQLLAPLRLPFGHGIVGSAAAHGRPELVPDTRRDTRYVPDVGVHGRSELAVALRLGDRVIGVIDTEHPRPDAYGDAHVQAFESVAALVLAASGPPP